MSASPENESSAPGTALPKKGRAPSGKAQVESRLRESEERYRKLINVMPVCVAVHVDHQIAFINEAGARMLGATGPQEIIGRLTADFLVPDDQGRVLDLSEDLLRGGPPVGPLAMRVRRLDGQFIDVESYATGITFDNRPAVQSVMIDVTERVRAEKERREEGEFAYTLLQASPAYFVAISPDGKVLLMNGAMLTALGRTIDEVIGQDFIRSFVPSTDRESFAQVVRQVTELKEPTTAESAIITRDGRERVVEWRSRPILKENGELDYFFAVGIDLTDRKRAEEERRRLEEKIQRSQKLESLGILAGGIAHDFNNLLVSILGNADLALSALPPDTPVRDTIQDIIQGSHRAAELCRQMLAYSGRGRLIVEPVDLSRLVREMTHMLEVAIAKNVVLRCNLSDDLPAIEGDATQLRQVVMNLIINASEAIGKRSGYVAVTTALKQCDESFLHSCFLGEHLPPGRYVILQVEDTGCGMDDETRARIFDPFFSTKFTGRGLGLSAVLGIVRGHQGAISVESQPGEGTKFTMLFPASSKPVTAAPAPAESEWRRCGTVLIVDDEDAVRLLARKMVKMCGLKTLLARDGREAVAVFKEKAAEIDCVLLDLTMPHMDGEEAFKAMRAIRPDARIIVSSGYSEQDISERFTLDAKVTFIQKPYARGPLVAALKKVLGEKPPPAG